MSGAQDSTQNAGGASSLRFRIDSASLISGSLYMLYGALCYTLGGWTLAIETSAGIFLVAVVLIFWRTYKDVREFRASEASS